MFPVKTEQQQSKQELIGKSTTTTTPMPLWLLRLVTLVLLTIHIGEPVGANSHELRDEVLALLGGKSNDSPTDDDTAQLMNEGKRSWQSLQSSWGKRSQAGGASSAPEEYDSQAPAEFNGLEVNEHPEPLKYSVIYASNPNDLAAAVAAAASVPTNNDQQVAEEDNLSNPEKRRWKNMNVAWGKRRSAVWNKFRGAWGKREPGWNNLKGMWGKRSPGDWKKLQSAWGKRSQQH